MALTPPSPAIPPKDLSLLAMLKTAVRNPLEVWSQRYYQDMVVKRKLLGQTYIVFNHPDAIRQVLNTNWTSYEKQVATRRILIPQAGDTAIFLAEGEDWKRQRRILSPAFTPRNIEKLLPHFTRGIQEWAAALDAASPVNISNQVQLLTLKVAMQSMFSLSIDPATEADIIAMFKDYAFRVGSPNMWDMIAKDIHAFAFATRKREAFKKRWFDILDGFISQQRNKRDTDKIDVLDLLNNARDSETGEGLSHAEIRDEIATLISAGFETTARSLFWTFYLLALAPEWQERLLEEINRVPDLLNAPSMDKIELLTKTKAVWQESMRLYPPGAIITRQAIAPNRIMETEVPKGSQIIISPWLLHRHEAYWENPSVFDPTRFYPDAKPIPKGVYIPFGSGPRVCIGNLFATMEAILMIAGVVKNWKISLIDTKPLTPVMLTATMPSYEPMFTLKKR